MTENSSTQILKSLFVHTSVTVLKLSEFSFNSVNIGARQDISFAHNQMLTYFERRLRVSYY
jgi:hypothetical protein